MYIVCSCFIVSLVVYCVNRRNLNKFELNLKFKFEFGFYKSIDVEKVHIGFLKQILGVRTPTSIVAVYGELGRFPLVVLRKIRILKYWLNMNANFECWAACICNLF